MAPPRDDGHPGPAPEWEPGECKRMLISAPAAMTTAVAQMTASRRPDSLQPARPVALRDVAGMRVSGSGVCVTTGGPSPGVASGGGESWLLPAGGSVRVKS